MPLRPATPADIRALAELWDRCFPGERTVGDRVRQLEAGLPHGGVEIVHAWDEDGRVIAAFKALRLQQVFSGVPLPTLGLAAVAVAPDRRRRGLGAALCREAIRLGRDRGDLISTLYPFRPAFYRALGWGLCGRLHAHVFDPAWLPDHAERNAVRSATADDLPALAACYRTVADRSNGLLLRHEALWRQLLGDGRAQPFVVSDGGQITGYLIAHFGSGPHPESRLLRVSELVAATDAAYRALLGWLSSVSDQWRRVRYDAHPAERFEHRLADPRVPNHRRERALYFPVARVIAGPMVRVLDVPAALRARAAAPPVTLTIEVVDGVLPENRGPWLWTPDGEVVSAQGREQNTDAQILTDAATFAQLYAGELRPSEAVTLGLAQSSGDMKAADLAFRPTAPFRLLDEF
jgi:predicted acetyltransferase